MSDDLQTIFQNYELLLEYVGDRERIQSLIISQANLPHIQYRGQLSRILQLLLRLVHGSINAYEPIEQSLYQIIQSYRQKYPTDRAVSLINASFAHVNHLQLKERLTLKNFDFYFDNIITIAFQMTQQDISILIGSTPSDYYTLRQELAEKRHSLRYHERCFQQKFEGQVNFNLTKFNMAQLFGELLNIVKSQKSISNYFDLAISLSNACPTLIIHDLYPQLIERFTGVIDLLRTASNYFTNEAFV